MCGIAGLIGEKNESKAQMAVGRMVNALARRGPDDEGIEVWPTAVLGHRRLSIFDLSDAGRQPMLSNDGEIGVVFNGAIYNFLGLRRDLETRGYQFRSMTDTEVLIHGYREWGFDTLMAKLKGMFAIGLWDNRARKLFLVRDRLGVKPLLYSHHDGKLAFGSTVRAIRAGGFADEIDEQSLAEYLEFGFVTDGRTIYKGIAKVPAATIVEWSNGTVRTREYWAPPSVSAEGSPTFEEAIEETERLFLDAVEKRLQADVPVGTLLSGGIDSSLVCWAVSKLGGNIKAFTVGTPGDPWDETADARATAEILKIDHRVIQLSAEEAPDVSDMVKAYGEPFACASSLGMLSVSKAVRESATVLLTGDGGDDVFLGYPEHLNFWRAEKLARALPSVTAQLWASTRNVFPDSGPLRRMRSFVDYTTGGLGAAACVRDGLPMYVKNGLFGERLAHARVIQRSMPWSMKSARQLLSDFLIYDRRMRFVGEYLTKVDGATMYHALEARSPFLDQDLWWFASTLPFDLRLKGGQLKAVLREIARRRIGERVANGRKRGFGIPVHRWMAGKWRERVEETFCNSYLSREGWINETAVLAQLKEAVGQGWAPTQLWYLFVLESWLKFERDEPESRKPGVRSREASFSTVLAQERI
jgi:asparagine synthase (glutamine-hydrolysing)